MNAITRHEALPPVQRRPIAAVSAGAGGIWIRLYQAVTGGAGLYVQGGGCRRWA